MFNGLSINDDHIQPHKHHATKPFVLTSSPFYVVNLDDLTIEENGGRIKTDRYQSPSLTLKVVVMHKREVSYSKLSRRLNCHNNVEIYILNIPRFDIKGNSASWPLAN